MAILCSSTDMNHHPPRTIPCGDRRPYVVPPLSPLAIKSKEVFSDDFAPYFRPVGCYWRGECPLTTRNLKQFVETFELCEVLGYKVGALPDRVKVEMSVRCAAVLLTHPSPGLRLWTQLNLLPRLGNR